MKPQRLAIVAFLAPATVGCRTRPETRAMFEAYQEEARRLEGVIYRLQYERDVACEENERLKRQLALPDSRRPARTDTGPRLLGPRETRPRPGATSPRPSGTTEDPDVGPIEIDPGPETPPPASGRPTVPPTRTEKPESSGADAEAESETPVESPDEPPLLQPRSLKPSVVKPQPKKEVEPVAPQEKQPEVVIPEVESPAIEKLEPETIVPETIELPAPQPKPKAKPAEDVSLDQDPPPALKITQPKSTKVDDDSEDEAPPNPPSVLKPRNTPKPSVSEELPPPAKQTPSKPRLPSLLPATSTSTGSTPQDQHVAHLFLDPQLTRGLDLDDQNGDDGLRIVLEPRNANGQLVPIADKVVIDVFDPIRRTQIGHWEFDAATVRYQLRLAGKRHIALDLPWSDQKPLGTRLSVIAQMQTDAGHSLRTSGEVNIVLPGQIAQRWTPRPAQRSGSLAKSIDKREVEPATYTR